MYLGFVFGQHRRLAAWARRQEPCTDPQLLKLLERCKEDLGLRRKLQVVATNRFSVPTLFGFWRPRLLLPAGILAHPELMRMVLLHELVHLKRHHVLENWALVFLQALHWFNPAVWLAFRRLRAERELACDARVLSVLQPAEHHAYGTALLKILEMSSKPLLMPALVPIVNNHHQIHRRITMIAEFKSARCLAGMASVLMLAAVAALTFTRATAQDVPDKPADKPKETKPAREKIPDVPGYPRDGQVPPPPGYGRAGYGGVDKVKVLQHELDVVTQQVKEAQVRADELKLKFGIPDNKENENEPRMGVLQRMEGLKIEAQSHYQEISSLYRELSKMPAKELRKVLPTAAPEPILVELLNRLTLAEQQLAEAAETYGTDHAEVKRKKRILDTINNQVTERIEGILEGLKTKAAASKARVDSLREEVGQTEKG